MSEYGRFEDMGADVIAAAAATASLWLKQAAVDYEARSVQISLTRLILGVRRAMEEEQRADNAWRPIHTAPKDGTWVLVYSLSWKDSPPEVATYDESFGWYMPGHEEPNEEVTHWMPLPPIPADLADRCQQRHPERDQRCLLPEGHGLVTNDFTTHSGESATWLTWSDGRHL